jgi:hypothetical protein
MMIALSASAHAATVLYASPQELGAESEIVILGRVESSESGWDDSRTKIITRTRIAVDETYKGNPPAAIDVVQLGGTVGTLRVTAHGAPVWKVGEEVLLFAEPHDAVHFRVSGYTQGKFGIERDPRTGEAFVRAPRMDGILLLGAPAESGMDARLEAGVPLEEFIQHALGKSTGTGVSR